MAYLSDNLLSTLWLDMAGPICFFIILYFVCNYFISKEFAKIAVMKGHNSGSYFWFCFLFTVVGWVMVAILPDKNKKN
jgi:hypothetical protein